MAESQELDPLLAQLRNGMPGDPDAEWKAAISLGEVVDTEDRQRAVSALIDAVTGNWAHALIRAHAVESLGKLREPQAVAALSSVVQQDEYRLVRAYAIAPLVELGAPDNVIDILLTVLDSDDFYGVRAEAAAGASALAASHGDLRVRDRVRQSLAARRKTELSLQKPGSHRVVAEIDRGLKRIGESRNRKGEQDE